MQHGAPVPEDDPPGRLARRSIGRWLPTLAALTAVTAVLAMTAWGLRWRPSVRLSATSPDADLLTTVLLALVVLGTIVAIPVAVLMSRGDGGGGRRPRPKRSWRDVVGRIVILALLLVVASQIERPKPVPPRPTSPTPVDAEGRSQVPADQGTAAWSWLSGTALAVLVVVVALLVGLSLARARATTAALRARPVAGTPSRGTFAAAAAAGRRALDIADGDRSAVIACYSAMQASLAGQGLPTPPSDTTADLLERARDLGLVHGPAAAELADLFRHARYSTEPMPAGARELASRALQAIAAEALATGRTQ